MLPPYEGEDLLLNNFASIKSIVQFASKTVMEEL